MVKYLVLLLGFSASVIAEENPKGFFVGAHYIPQSKFSSNSRYLESLSGKGKGVSLGYNNSHVFLVEAFYERIDYDEKLCAWVAAHATLIIEETNIGLGIRWYFLKKMLGIRSGWHYKKLDRRFFNKITGKEITNFSFDYDANNFAPYLGATVQLPIQSLAVYGDYTMMFFKGSTKTYQLSLGLRYTF